VLAKGADWFGPWGRRAPGTIIATVVGDVRRPGVHEVEMGAPSPTCSACGGPPAVGSGERRCPACRTAVLPRPTSTCR
jgi:NADH:ubiquinone oxidoreductase subunit F (NADH-binding)